MQEGGFYQQRRMSPTGIAVVVLLHGAAITALALAKMDVPAIKIFTPLKIENVAPDPVPVPPPPAPPRKADPQQSRIDTPETLIPTLPKEFEVIPSTQDPVTFDPAPIGDAKPKPNPDPVPLVPPQVDPVRIEAKLKGGALQPPYPASEQRAEREGRVVVRVVIGTDGRVKAVERVSATSDAFFTATERHALRAWRFAPATEDGRPVESRKTMSITFQLAD